MDGRPRASDPVGAGASTSARHPGRGCPESGLSHGERRRRATLRARPRGPSQHVHAAQELSEEH